MMALGDDRVAYYFLNGIKECYQHPRLNQLIQRIAIFFDASKQTEPYLGHGYVIPGLKGNGPEGYAVYQCVFYYPVCTIFFIFESQMIRNCQNGVYIFGNAY